MSPPEHEKKLAEELRLRPERPPVTRLSRRALIALSAVSAAVILGLTVYALQSRGRASPPSELFNTEAKTTADGLALLPRDYTALPKNVPKLGPPLPGDLGRPILAAQGQFPAPAAVDPEEQRIGQEREAARTAKLFATTNARERPAPSAGASLSTTNASSVALPVGEAPPIDPNAVQNMQDRKLTFINAPVDRRTVNSDRLAPPASPYVLQAGAVIPVTCP